MNENNITCYNLMMNYRKPLFNYLKILMEILSNVQPQRVRLKNHLKKKFLVREDVVTTELFVLIYTLSAQRNLQ